MCRMASASLNGHGTDSRSSSSLSAVGRMMMTTCIFLAGASGAIGRRLAPLLLGKRMACVRLHSIRGQGCGIEEGWSRAGRGRRVRCGCPAEPSLRDPAGCRDPPAYRPALRARREQDDGRTGAQCPPSGRWHTESSCRRPQCRRATHTFAPHLVAVTSPSRGSAPHRLRGGRG